MAMIGQTVAAWNWLHLICETDYMMICDFLNYWYIIVIAIKIGKGNNVVCLFCFGWTQSSI